MWVNLNPVISRMSLHNSYILWRITVSAWTCKDQDQVLLNQFHLMHWFYDDDGRYSYWRFYPNARAQHRINDVKALHRLLAHHIDDLEDIMAAVKDKYSLDRHRGKSQKLGKEEFAQVVHQTIRKRAVYPEEMDLLYKVFDTDRDGFLSLAEVAWHETKLKHTPVEKRKSSRAWEYWFSRIHQ